jgi:hypothetical protein
LTAVGVIDNASAASCVDRSSMSRRISTAR